MDYVAPVEAIVPGVQGKVLGVLTRTGVELTMSNVARLAGVSVNRAVNVLNDLASLGLVARREAGSAALVALVPENEAVRAILALANVHNTVMTRMRAEAATIDPAPASLIVFGSFARRGARAGSDVDVLAIRPSGVPADDPNWSDSLARWTDRVGRISGNPVNLIETSSDDLRTRLKRRDSVWAQAVRDGVILAGAATPEQP